MTATKCSKCGGWVAKRGEWIEVDSVHDVPKRCSCDDTLTFAEAMALDPSEVEVDADANGDWKLLADFLGYTLLRLRKYAKFRRSRPKRSRVQEMAEEYRKGPGSRPFEGLVEATIRSVCEYLRKSDSTKHCPRVSADDIEREFLEPR